MRTVGEILKEEREAKFYSLDEVEKATKIRKELLEALEADDYNRLPPSTFVQGFIKNYARFLNLDAQKLLAVYRREFSDKKHPPQVMDAFANPLEKTKLQFTPAKLLGLVVVLVVISFFVYLWTQYRQFALPPTLQISSPTDQLTTDNPLINVEGKTDPEVKVAINNQDISVDTEGKFKEEISLTSATNKITISAISKFGQKITLERTVYLKR